MKLFYYYSYFFPFKYFPTNVACMRPKEDNPSKTTWFSTIRASKTIQEQNNNPNPPMFAAHPNQKCHNSEASSNFCSGDWWVTTVTKICLHNQGKKKLLFIQHNYPPSKKLTKNYWLEEQDHVVSTTIILHHIMGRAAHCCITTNNFSVSTVKWQLILSFPASSLQSWQPQTTVFQKFKTGQPDGC